MDSNKRSFKRLFLPALLLLLFFLSLNLIRSGSADCADSGWNYFPTNLSCDPKAERLGLISRGPAYTYTPGVYELRIPKNPGYIDLQIWDAPTHEENRDTDVDYVRNGIHTMDLVFENTNKVQCI